MLYRLLRPDEDWQLGLSPKDPNSTKSVFGRHQRKPLGMAVKIYSDMRKSELCANV